MGDLAVFILELIRKRIFVIALVAAVVGLTAGLISVINTAIDSVAVSLPTDVIEFASTVLPTNLTACISVVIAGRVARFVYDWHIKIATQLAQ